MIALGSAGRIRQTMKFEDFKLPYGYPLQLQVSVDGQVQRAASTLIGCIPGKVLLIALPRGNIRLRGGQKVIVQIMVGNGICLFPVQVEALIGPPLPMILLTCPKQINFKEIRSATRVEVNTPIDAKNVTSLLVQSSMGIISDISVSGARLQVATPVGEVGDQLSIQGRVQVGPINRELQLTAVIRSRVERSTTEVEDELPAVFGVEFIETNEDQLLLLYAFVNAQLAAK